MLNSFTDRTIEVHSSVCIIFLAGTAEARGVVVVTGFELVHVQPAGVLNITRVNILEHMRKYTHMHAARLTDKLHKRAHLLFFCQLLTGL